MHEDDPEEVSFDDILGILEPMIELDEKQAFGDWMDRLMRGGDKK